MLTPFTDQYTNALGRGARGGARCSSSCIERSDRSPGESAMTDERSPGRDPVRADACMVVLG